MAVNLKRLVYFDSFMDPVANAIIGSNATPDKLVEGFQAAFAVGAAFAAIGLIATLTLIRSSDSRAHVELGKEAPATE